MKNVVMFGAGYLIDGGVTDGGGNRLLGTPGCSGITRSPVCSDPIPKR